MTYTTIQLRRGTAAEWSSENPVLELGEYGFETDTRKSKIGDGATSWTALPYLAGGSSGSVTAVKTAGYTAAPGDIIPCDATTAGFTVTLPAAPENGTRILVKKVDDTANAVLIQRSGTDVFNKAGGPSTLQLAAPTQTVDLRYETGIWHVIANGVSPTGLAEQYAPLKMTALKDVNGRTVVGLSATASSVAHVVVAGGAPTPSITVESSNASADLGLSGKGAGRVTISGNGGKIADFAPIAANGVNYFQFTNATSGTIAVWAQGADANIPIQFNPKSATNPELVIGKGAAPSATQAIVRTSAGVDLNLQGAGGSNKVLANGVEVCDISTPQTLAGKTLNAPKITGAVPASATAAGTAGQIAWDADHFYVCVQTGAAGAAAWKRAALTTW